tara:strand:+ start:7683 stop:8393 length:711 start_codon:yes stop_codon:yes gene_type:complete
MKDLLEIYKKSFVTRKDEGLSGPGEPEKYLNNKPGPMPPKQSPIDAKYEETRENQPEDGTSIDGGSTNDPVSGFVQTYTSENPYYTTKEGEVRANMNNPLNKSLKVTALDVEKPEAGVKQGGSGGPNRTAAANGTKSSFLEGGNYKVLRYPTKAKFIETNEGDEDAGTLETMTLQQYTPDRTYLEVLADPSNEIEEVIGGGLNQQPSAGGVPTSVDESIVPDSAKPSLNDLKNFNI